MASSLFGVALAVAGGGPGALDSATPPFHDCLTHPVGPRADFPLLPLFGYCRNASCVDEAHGQQGGRNRPRTDSSTGERAPLGELHGQLTRPIAEFTCATDADQEEAVVLSKSAMQWSMPLVLRGCAWEMPARRRWANASYLRATAEQAFAPVLGLPSDPGGHTGDLDALDPALLADTWWPSAVGEWLFDFAREPGAKGLWVTSGGKRAAVHYDTFDNFHVVVSGHKEFRLVSPQHAATMYIDFPASDCPGDGNFGCDNLGCFAFVPFDANDVDLIRFPRVADAEVLSATLAEGDVLMIPALWFHYVLHHPLSGGGKCIALTFTRQQRWERMAQMAPFAADLKRHWQQKVQSRANDPGWRESNWSDFEINTNP